MGNPEPNPVFLKQRFRKRKKRDRCRDSMEVVLTNGGDYAARGLKLQKGSGHLLNTISIG